MSETNTKLREKFEERFNKRTQEREQAKQQKQSTNESELTVAQFWAQFQKILQLPLGEDIKEAEAKKLKSEAQAFLNTNILVLNQYDVRKANEQIAAYEKEIEKKFDPKLKPKFSFSRKTKAAAEASSTTTQTLVKEEVNKIVTTDAHDKKIENIQDSAVILKAGEPTNESLLTFGFSNLQPQDNILVSDCSNSTLAICKAVGAVYFQRLKNCKIFVGPVKGAIFVRDAENCTFHLAAQQIRIHTSTNCDFYVLCKSTPIIEDSKGLRFAPYGLKYDGIGAHLTESSLSLSDNSWDQVKDFNWIKQSQSPNWSILPENERKDEAV